MAIFAIRFRGEELHREEADLDDTAAHMRIGQLVCELAMQWFVDHGEPIPDEMPNDVEVWGSVDGGKTWTVKTGADRKRRVLN